MVIRYCDVTVFSVCDFWISYYKDVMFLHDYEYVKGTFSFLKVIIFMILSC